MPILYAFPGTRADYANDVISSESERLRHWHNPRVCQERHTRWARVVHCLSPTPLSLWRFASKITRNKQTDSQHFNLLSASQTEDEETNDCAHIQQQQNIVLKRMSTFRFYFAVQPHTKCMKLMFRQYSALL